MTKNPFYNALFASMYIVGLVSLVFFAPHMLGEKKESILYPMAALSVLVFSVALMAYLFFYQPVLMLLDGQREKAVTLFLRTVGIFGGATVAILLISIIVSV